MDVSKHEPSVRAKGQIRETDDGVVWWYRSLPR